eukprot:550726-Alexandrium_andersonii.AAC.1
MRVSAGSAEVEGAAAELRSDVQGVVDCLALKMGAGNVGLVPGARCVAGVVGGVQEGPVAWAQESGCPECRCRRGDARSAAWCWCPCFWAWRSWCLGGLGRHAMPGWSDQWCWYGA